jgi:hypothetical protein
MMRIVCGQATNRGGTMNDEIKSGINWSFWVIAAIALIWNAMTVMNYFAQMNPDMLAAYRESERALIESRPAWATGAFAIAAFGGAIGSLLLLLRKSVAFYLFVASLLGVVVIMLHPLGVFGPSVSLSAGEIAGMIVAPAVVAAFFAWYSKFSEKKGWIG